MMDSTNEKLFAMALDLKEPLYVERIEFNPNKGRLDIFINFRKGASFKCPECQEPGKKVHDTKARTWRHLNFFQFETYLHFRTPRVICKEHGTLQIEIPWAKPGSGFTMLFEALVLELARQMPVNAIAKMLNEHDTRLWRILDRYVTKALKEVDYSGLQVIGIDETAAKRGHNYVTVVMDMVENRVVYVTEGKDSKVITSFKDFLKSVGISHTQITDISADMSVPFKKGLESEFPHANVTYDKFHVIKLMNEALDRVRRQERSEVPELKNARYALLKNPSNLTANQRKKMATLSQMNLGTVKAYHLKLALQDIYSSTVDKMDAMTLLHKWSLWAKHTRIEPLVKMGFTVTNHFAGILNYFDNGLTNGRLEGMNSIIQMARTRARGFRNIKNFKTMIYLMGGKLDLPILHSVF